MIPIPLHKSRERVRGFNQSRLIAQECARSLRRPLHTDILHKTKKTAPQMELLREARLTNLAGAFTVSSADAIRNRTCILIDDVKTTGATMESAARTLKDAGAGKIWAITIAR
ncbi:MAG: ComF family protein [Candidatus Sungbacteria bacterium]|nr:ComF family protein [Candidatus Sungbacteria bacterium]